MLSRLVKDERFQMRAKLDAGTVDRYATILKHGGSLPPLQVFDVSGALVLVDGWHRAGAMEGLGWTEADAEVVLGDAQGALWAAATANLQHGLPLKRKELRSVFRAYVETGRHRKGPRRLKSYREITADLNGTMSHNTVRHWMLKDFPRIAAAMGGGDGAAGGLPDGGGQMFSAKAGQALEALAAALQAYNAVVEPEERRRVVLEGRRVVGEMERAGSFPPETFDF